jgi:hypothetical protein
LFFQGETAVNLPESYPLFSMHQPQAKLSAPYWSDGLERDHDLTLPVESVVGVLSQPANDDTKPYAVDEGALKAYELPFSQIMKYRLMTVILQVLRKDPPHTANTSKLEGAITRYSTQM